MSEDFRWEKPYTREWDDCLSRWEILFEGDSVASIGSAADARKIADLLNGAYNLGRAHARAFEKSANETVS